MLRVARTINPMTNLGGPLVGFTCESFDSSSDVVPHPFLKIFRFPAPHPRSLN